jgi:hypothetical protein
MTKAFRSLVAMFCLAMSLAVHAERCEMIGGCVGEIWYVHVPSEQRTKALIFSTSGVPKVGASTSLLTPVSLLNDFVMSSERYRAELVSALSRAASAGRSLEGWGMTLQPGSRVTILGYQTFPQLGEMAGAKFAKVRVESDGET